MRSDDNAVLWGELREGLHGAGYLFERACSRLKTLLKNGGWKVGGQFKNVHEFLDSLQFENLKVAAEDRKEIARLIKKLEPKVSNRRIAKTLRVGKDTINRDTGANAPRGQKKPNKNNAANLTGGANAPLAGYEAARVVARAERVKDQQQSVNERTAKITLDARKLGKFSVILADPPWDDEFGASTRSIENHYPTMRFADILALPVGDIAHEQAMLFLWATPSMIEMALETARAWGFQYRTQMVWVKPSIGLGKYVRQRHELLLICRRGEHPAPDPKLLPDSVIEAARSEHSVKPETFFEIIERMYPELPKIELFARRARPRWAAWGNEAPPQDASEIPDMPDFLRRTSDQAAS
jgi:N6-adenosine-specific RNA methylase IME4